MEVFGGVTYKNRVCFHSLEFIIDSYENNVP
jgi:hypothetical protein